MDARGPRPRVGGGPLEHDRAPSRPTSIGALVSPRWTSCSPSATERLTPDESAFLAASRAAIAADHDEVLARIATEERHNRRLRRALALVAVLLVVASVAGVVALVQRGRADEQQQLAVARLGEAEQQRAAAESQRLLAEERGAEADEQRAEAEAQRGVAEAEAERANDARVASELATLASRSLGLRSSERDVAALLAVEAYRRSPDATSRSALFGTFTFDPGFLGYSTGRGRTRVFGSDIPGTGDILVAAVAGDGADAPPRLERVDAATMRPVRRYPRLLPGLGATFTVGVSGNGRYAVVREVIGDESIPAPRIVIGVFDLDTGERVGGDVAGIRKLRDASPSATTRRSSPRCRASTARSSSTTSRQG